MKIQVPTEQFAIPMTRRTLLKSTGAAGGAAALATVGLSHRAGAQADGHVVVVLPEEPPDLDPFYYALSHIPVTRNIYEALIERASGAPEILPGLATSWEQTDETTWRFTLRDDVTYHNDAPFNAAAAAFGINWAITQNTNASGNFIEGTTATAVDDVTLDVTTPTPDPILPLRLYVVGLPEPSSWEADPVGSMRAPIGTGPYKMVEFAGGEHITVEAFEDYWGGASEVTTGEFVWRTESPVRVSMIEAGEADIARDVAPQDADEAHSVSVTIPETPFLRLDVPSPPLDDLRIRQAINLSLNRQELADTVFGGYAVPAGQIVTPDVVGYNPNLPPVEQDLEQATALVQEAAAEGAPIDLELTIFGRIGIYPNAAEAMEIVQIWLQSIGLNVTVNMMDVAAWTEVILQQPIPEDRRGILQSSAGAEIGDASLPVGGYFTSTGSQSPIKDPELDQMQQEAQSLQGEERAAAYAEIFRYINDTQMPVVPMVHIQAIYAVSDRVTWEPRSDNLILLKTVTFSGA